MKVYNQPYLQMLVQVLTALQELAKTDSRDPDYVLGNDLQCQAVNVVALVCTYGKEGVVQGAYYHASLTLDLSDYHGITGQLSLESSEPAVSLVGSHSQDFDFTLPEEVDDETVDSVAQRMAAVMWQFLTTQRAPASMQEVLNATQ